MLAVARMRAETRMVDTVMITRTGAAGVFDNSLGTMGAGAAATKVYSGPCFLSEKRVQNPKARPIAGDFPFEEVATLHLPAASPQILPMDVATMLAAPDHPQDTGRRFRVISFDPSTQAKERRFQMSAIIG